MDVKTDCYLRITTDFGTSKIWLVRSAYGIGEHATQVGDAATQDTGYAEFIAEYHGYHVTGGWYRPDGATIQESSALGIQCDVLEARLA